jgi:hypothetical protein
VGASIASCSGGHGDERVSSQSQSLVSPNGAITAKADEARTGWYPNQPALTPSVVSGSTFGRLFTTKLPLSPGELVFAQPLVSGTSVFVATEANDIYTLDSETGAVQAARSLGPAFNAADVSCGDLYPTIGVTGTPVIDASTNIAYFFSKTYKSSSSTPAWYAHAVDVATLTEQANFPVEIAGTATNSSATFDPKVEHQRPGLLFMNGVVYAGFGSHCDGGDYRGFVVGVSTKGSIVAMFATEPGPPTAHGAGIWQSGGGLASDGAGRIFFMTGNGYDTPLSTPTPTNSPPATLENALVRVDVQSDGSLVAKQFFLPYDAATLDQSDLDFGAGGPLALPNQFGTTAHPHLVLAGGKEGNLYLLDRDNLGGFEQGPNNGDGALAEVSTGKGLWSTLALWPGDGGWIYAMTNQGPFEAFSYGLESNGVPALTLVGKTTDTFGFTSSPIVTSNGTTSGSAIVWITYNGGATKALRAYNPIPDSSGTLDLLFQDALSCHSKFAVPGVGNGRIYVGTCDGQVVGYGAPITAGVSGSPVNFSNVVVGQSSTQTVVLTANQATQISAISSSDGSFTVGTPSSPLPANLAQGGTLSVPVTFTPANAQSYVATLNVTTSTGAAAVSMQGTGLSPNGVLAGNRTTIRFGGLDIGASLTSNVILSNTGAGQLVFSAFAQPAAPFSVSSPPAAGQVLAGGASVTVPVTFAPTAAGSYSATLQFMSDSGTVSVYVSGTSAAPTPLTITPLALNFGNVAAGATSSMSFTLSNPGAVDVTVTKSKPPSLGVFAATTTLTEGTVIAAGTSLTETVQFAPSTTGTFNDQWIIGDNGGGGAQTVTFTGTSGAFVIGQSTVLPIDDSGNGNWMIAQSATLSKTATIESLSFYVVSAAGSLRLGVYDATGPGGGPGAKVAETPEITTTTVGWDSANVVSPVSLSAGTYWLAYLSSSDALHSRRTGDGGGASQYYVLPYGPLPSTFATGATTDTVQWSVFATLVPVTPGQDAGTSADGAPGSDAGPPVDSSSGADVSPPVDSSSGADVSPPVDSSSGADVGPALDSGPTGPTVATAAAATLSSSGRTATLSVLGADSAGEASLVYTWSTTGMPPAAATFSPNGTNAAKSAIATFASAGTYSLNVKISDAQGNATSSATTVAVPQMVTTVAVTPASVSLQTKATQQFAATADDQFGALVAPAPAFAWSVSAGGSVTTSGLFTAGSAPGGPFSVVAASGGQSGAAAVTITAPPPITIGQSSVLPIDDSSNGNWMIAQKATLSETATIESLSFYVVSASGSLRLGIYDATGSGGGPGAKLAETPEITTTTVGWDSANVVSPVSLPAGTYWLAYLSSSDALHSRRTGNGGGASQYYVLPYGPLPSTFATGATTDTVQWSVFATLQP